MRARLLAPLLAAGFVAGAVVAEVGAKKPPADLSAQEIEACVQKNFPSDSMIQTMKMVMKDRMGVERLLEADMFWEKDPATQLSKVLLQFDNPPELRCAAVLVLEKSPGPNDMFMFLPELGKVRRITTSMVNGSMLGTDFSYEDFARLQGMVGSLQSERAADEQVDGHAAFVTLAKPTDANSEYDRIRSTIDQKTCVPLRVEFFQKGAEEPAKVLTVDPAKVTEVKTGWMPKELRMEDRQGGTSTNLVIEKLQVSVPIPKQKFSQSELDKQKSCRAAVPHF